MATSNDDYNHEAAFWLDAADLAIEDWDQARASADVTAARRAFRGLVAVACKCRDGADPRVAATRQEIDKRLSSCGDPALLRSAFAKWPDDPAWAAGDYQALLTRSAEAKTPAARPAS